MRRIAPTSIVVVSLLMAVAGALPAQAYIGPGAGFAIASSFLVIFVTVSAGAGLAADPAVPHLVARLRTPKTDEAADPSPDQSSASTDRTPNSPTGSWPRASCPTSRSSPTRAATGAWPPPTPRSRRSPGRPSHRDASRPSTTSTTSSTGTGAPTCPCSRRPRSARSRSFSRSASTASRCTSRSCGCCASRYPSGPSSASTTSGAPCCGCRSPFRRIASTAHSWRLCASPTCSVPRAPFFSTPPASPRASSRRAACGSSCRRASRAGRRRSTAPRTSTSRTASRSECH